MSIILSIDTSTTSGSVSLLKEGSVIGIQQYKLEQSHSSLLHVMMNQLVTNVGIEMKELSAIAIAEGPGSYTGLRIGASAAKGLCFSLNIPLIAVNTLEAMAYKVFRYSTASFFYCPMIDARRMEVFAMLLDDEFKVLKPTTPILLEEYNYEDILERNKILFFGDGATKAKNVIQHPNAQFIDDVVPSAEEIGLLANSKLYKEEFENVVDFEPFYLKEFRLATANKS